MAWKHALAKLKQDLKAEPEAAPPPKPKVLPKPEGPPRSMEDEDAMFLAAMGRRAPQAPASRRPAPEVAAPAPAPVPPDATDFRTAMEGLKGMKSIPKGAPETLVAPPAPAVAPPVDPAPPPPAPPEEPAAQPPVAVEPPPPSAPSVSSGPRLIHLAAGMAIEVDGVLDLRAHSVADARERLVERIQDGRFLGWRTLHIHLGPDPALRDMLLALLKGEEAGPLLQYAQAPVPMGGSQSWILYFHLA